MNCSVEDCGRPGIARQLCGTHYKRWQKRGDPGNAALETESRGAECSVEGCASSVKSKQLCEMHYARRRRDGSPGPADAQPRHGEHAPRWVNGRYQNKQGYFCLYRPDHPAANKKGYVAEHRVVAEKAIGRFLTPDEVAHHINEQKGDNRPENLAVMTASAHARLPHANRRGRPPKKAIA